MKRLERDVKFAINKYMPIYWSALILKTLKAESDWIDKVKKDKGLTKKQIDDAIMVMYGVGIREAEIFIAGCKHGDYTLHYFPDGSVIQKFIRREK